MGRPKTVSDEEKKIKHAERMRKRWLNLSPEQKAEHYRRKNEARNKEYAEKARAEGREVKQWHACLGDHKLSSAERCKRWKEKNLEAARASDVRRHREVRATEEGKKKSHVISKIYREKNKEKIRTAYQVWRASNREKDLAYKKSHYQENKQSYRAWNHARRARVKSVGGKHTAKDIAELVKKQKGKCAWCLLALGEDRYHVDHYVPLALGGSNDKSNLRILHRKCNMQKHKKHPADFAQQNGLLCW